jgi:hypothetical protein
MGPLLAAAVIGAVAWLLWLWLSRARRVAVASAEVRRGIDRDRARVGALPSGALEVASAAAIEPRAEREPCPWCGGALHVDQHEVEEHAGDRLRRVDARCGSCSRVTTTWFRIRAHQPN